MRLGRVFLVSVALAPVAIALGLCFGLRSAGASPATAGAPRASLSSSSPSQEDPETTTTTAPADLPPGIFDCSQAGQALANVQPGDDPFDNPIVAAVLTYIGSTTSAADDVRSCLFTFSLSQSSASVTLAREELAALNADEGTRHSELITAVGSIAPSDPGSTDLGPLYDITLTTGVLTVGSLAFIAVRSGS